MLLVFESTLLSHKCKQNCTDRRVHRKYINEQVVAILQLHVLATVQYKLSTISLLLMDNVTPLCSG